MAALRGASPGAASLARVGVMLAVLLPGAGACDRTAELWIEGRAVDASARGLADDASPAAPPDRYEEDGPDLWARDSLTTAYSDPPRPGDLAGGVAAEPSDTAVAAGSPDYAVARSLNRVSVPLEVRRAGRVELEIVLELVDVELANAGVPRVELDGRIVQVDGAPVPGGDIGTLALLIEPDGAVIIDERSDEPGRLEPNGRFTRVLRGPVGGVRLGEGRYRVEMALALEATAPARSGPHQIARIGRARARLRTR